MSLRTGLARTCAAALAAITAVTPVTVSAQEALSFVRDTEIEAIVRADAEPVFTAAGLNAKNIEVYLVGRKDLNAFVAGGQKLFLHTGLIMQTKNPSELIGVIAHETGHVALGHLARMDEVGKSVVATQVVTLGFGILAMLSGAPGSGMAGLSLLYGSNMFAAMQVMSYTRVQEAAADQAAASFLEKAGRSGKGLVDFFDNMRYQELFSDARKEPYFLSHPLSSERITALQNRVEKASSYTKADTPEALENHRIMVAKLRGFMNFPQKTYLDYPETDVSYPARYARAIARFRDRDPEGALKDIDVLLAERPNNPYLWELKGQVLFENGRAKESIAPHRKSVELSPRAPLLRINLGQALLASEGADNVNDAVVQLNAALDFEHDNPMAWRLLSEAYDRQGDAGMARLAAAEQNFWLDQAPMAGDFARRARELLPKDTPQWRRANDIAFVVEGVERQRREEMRRRSPQENPR